ncbi:MAG: hypothetical protein KatS3mg113_0308 [Planctomycetaceae bacterium]|nr:MAG: hypothetical protein KatS3mg113_0308 [Planctomycetaceae bacterium]
MTTGTGIAVVVPVFDEAESLRELHAQLRRVAVDEQLQLQIIFVDDGSRDATWQILRELSAQDPQLEALRFRRNFGKAAALHAGFARVTQPLVLMIDADLQDDPAELPRLLAKLHEGYDLVNGWKQQRHDPWHKVYPSRCFNWMVGWMTGLSLHDHNCGLKLMRVEVIRELRLYGELHRFIPVLAHARGFRVTELPVHHRPRRYGHSKYGWQRFLKGFLDLFTVAFLLSYRHRPQHMLGAVGLTFLSIGVIGLGYLGTLWMLMNVLKWMPPQPIVNRPLLLYSVAVAVLGAQALTIGLLAELIVHYTSRPSDTYSIAEVISPTEDSSAQAFK